jgi:hypothetical protein
MSFLTLALGDEPRAEDTDTGSSGLASRSTTPQPRASAASRLRPDVTGVTGLAGASHHPAA